MKLMLIIIANEDANSVSKVLLNEKYFVTKLSTTGGLLRNGSTTLLVGTEDDRVDRALEIVSEFAKSRKQKVPAIQPDEFGMFSTLPFEVQVGGATIFVLNIDSFYKL
ncbi:MAG: cyclic-di-AMP receptor [Bacilli bacterium]|mgnify:CR=1 FL=1|nr:cyclic-di-AMP receptor [Mollicutes bacterium]MDY3898973.1 cyclic-di-AMP receptor [Bacilli bacterium]